jgi:trans-4-hydroxy-L-proline dehydratase
MMTDRIKKLRKQSVDAVHCISAERALLVTDFYKANEGKNIPPPIMRAKAFAHILEHKSICINEGEWIVGERGPAPKACPTYPEITMHSLEDLDILDAREKVFFKVDEATRKAYKEEIIPYWKGKSNRDRIMESMEAEWLDAYKAGVFTEFQEQRAPGHTVAGEKIFRKGMFEIIEEIKDTRSRIQDRTAMGNDHAMHDERWAMDDKKTMGDGRWVMGDKKTMGDGRWVMGDKKTMGDGRWVMDDKKTMGDGRWVMGEKQKLLDELEGMEIAARAIVAFANRVADALEGLAQSTGLRAQGSGTFEHSAKHEARNAELLDLARICRKVPAHAPETFHEALQHYWFIHLGVITELNPWDSFNPGRLDQHLYPFYKREIDAGTLTRDKAKELLESFWIKFNNHPAPPKIGVTALESNTYTDFCLINVGGVKPDGSDGVNEVTWLILDVIEEMRLLQPSSMVQVSAKNPDKLIERTLEITKTGFGQPSYFNTDAIVQELVRQGKTIEDARKGGASGCVEAGAFGTEAYILSGYFNLPKILEITLNNGFDPRTEKQIGPKTGNPISFASFDDLMEAYQKQLNHFLEIKMRGNNTIHRIFAEQMPVPFLSLIIEDCIANARDYNAGGARYNTTYIQGVGLGSITDSLTAIKHHVFDKQTITMDGLLQALKKDFRDFEEFRMTLVYQTPKYGNDDDQADRHALSVFALFFDIVDGKPTSIGGIHRINLLPTTSHVYFGSVIGALPDGRLAHQPLSEGISPFQGADTKGPTAVLNSAAKIDHLLTGGTLLNQKFSPGFFEGPDAIEKIRALIRAYFSMNGHHIQFNVVSAETLKDAQKHPERYRDLIVRVAGYSDYFNDLGEDLQNEIIRRTEQG